MQYLRDRSVDTEILNLLRKRLDDCFREEFPDHEKCRPLKDIYEDTTTNWFIKCKSLFVLFYLFLKWTLFVL